MQVMSLRHAQELTGLDPQALNDTDGMRLMVFEGEGQVLLAAVFDNLGKGAAGQRWRIWI